MAFLKKISINTQYQKYSSVKATISPQIKKPFQCIRQYIFCTITPRASHRIITSAGATGPPQAAPVASPAVSAPAG
ncbi:hypothetical protein HNQ50_003935 [Silvimonas terrae]|uniref:Uncharacterized protein n=1 Tax=Silvimonas terrae TaxID=300266 RepID=A0A840RM53_9NEIS|nr:hypothetical protein [Silvimonas terrae]MBB5193181.1 hypothetical protein [Silvimonas terrae]